MRLLRWMFRGLRGKLTLTYTLVTVLALLSIEILVITGILMMSSTTNSDKRSYVGDAMYFLSEGARPYLDSNGGDLDGLQAWLNGVYRSGKASLDPQDIFDSPAARIVTSDPLVVISPDGKILAEAPVERSDLLGRQYQPPEEADYQQVLARAMNRTWDALALSADTPRGDYYLAVPVIDQGDTPGLLGIIILTIEPSPPMILSTWPVMLGGVLGTGVLLVCGVAPFGTLFGFIMARTLVRRLADLTTAADAWGQGNFDAAPVDHGNDEIGYLAIRMRAMAEHIQLLLQTQQELAMLEERNRLARELHDTVKQQTFATLMQVRAARNLLTSDPEEAGQALEKAELQIKASQQDLGLIIAELRPAALEGQGLDEALGQLLETWSVQTRIPATYQVSNQRQILLAIEQALYRVAQEGLSNVARHSRASAVNVRLDYNPQEVSLELTDNGVGFDPYQPSAGMGLRNMRERMTILHGTLQVKSTPGNGALLRASVPTQKQEA